MANSSADAPMTLRRRDSADLLRRLTAESKDVLKLAKKSQHSPSTGNSARSNTPEKATSANDASGGDDSPSSTGGRGSIRRMSSRLGAPDPSIKGPRLSVNLARADQPEVKQKRRTSASPMIRSLAARAVHETLASSSTAPVQGTKAEGSNGNERHVFGAASRPPPAKLTASGSSGDRRGASIRAANAAEAKALMPSPKRGNAAGAPKATMSASKMVSQELLRSATGPTKTSREKVREKFVRKYVRQALRKLRIILTTPRGDAIVNNEVRQQKENRLFAETAIGLMRANDEKWDKLLDSVGMLAATPRGKNTPAKAEPVTFPQFQVLLQSAFEHVPEIDDLHCQAMWNLLVAQLQDVSRYVYPSTLYEFFVGELVISSDEDRAIKIILYQCEAQAHFYAHLAFSSTDGRKKVTGEELAQLIEHPEQAIRQAKAKSPSFSAALVQRNVENDIRYLLQLTVRDCTHEETMNNLHIITAEFEALVQSHNLEKKKLHESILELRHECRKQAQQLKEQAEFAFSQIADPAGGPRDKDAFLKQFALEAQTPPQRRGTGDPKVSKWDGPVLPSPRAKHPNIQRLLASFGSPRHRPGGGAGATPRHERSYSDPHARNKGLKERRAQAAIEQAHDYFVATSPKAAQPSPRSAPRFAGSPINSAKNSPLGFKSRAAEGFSNGGKESTSENLDSPFTRVANETALNLKQDTSHRSVTATNASSQEGEHNLAAALSNQTPTVPMPMPGKFDEIFLTVFSQKTQIASLEKELVATRREALLDSHLEKLHENRKLFEDDDDDEIEIGYEIDEYGVRTPVATPIKAPVGTPMNSPQKWRAKCDKLQMELERAWNKIDHISRALIASQRAHRSGEYMVFPTWQP
eukprot:INCI12104.2.p1 GENE.INCI12104.2~~INCI12104.2.p1  ORF type:complete len:868 (-),score=165.19 INCI12104.2:102-2705(-)